MNLIELLKLAESATEKKQPWFQLRTDDLTKFIKALMVAIAGIDHCRRKHDATCVYMEEALEQIEELLK